MKQSHARRGVTLAALLAAVTACGTADAASLTRGPYLQNGTPTSVLVVWNTNVATVGTVRYGPTLSSLDSSVSDLSDTVHAVLLDGLMPATRYWYQVEDETGLMAGSGPHSFTTAPVSGTVGPVRLFAWGDLGTGAGVGIPKAPTTTQRGLMPRDDARPSVL